LWIAGPELGAAKADLYGENMIIGAKAASLMHRVKTHFYKSSEEWKNHPLNRPFPIDDWEQIDRDIVNLASRFHFTVTDFVVDDKDYFRFRKLFWPGNLYAVGYKDKKIIEHYLSYKLLELKSSDVYIDVASENSPFPAIFRRELGMKTYSQDLSYRPGVHGDIIGSSADQMPIEDESADKISLHCSFEHFCQDVDRNFVHELKRVLRPNGRCLIVPLYLKSSHLNIVDPVLDYQWIQFDSGATVLAETNLGGLFERYYSPESLERILIPGLGLRYEIFRIRIPEAIRRNASKGIDRVRYALRITKDELIPQTVARA
jgi:SAM-dependent methyltransferase